MTENHYYYGSGVQPCQGHRYILPANGDVGAKMAKAIALCDEALYRATGLDPMSRRTCANYAAATYFVSRYRKFPILNPFGTGGTGKSATLGIMAPFCHNSNCFAAKGMTYPAIRDELAEAYFGTAIIEEADEVQGQAAFEGLLLQRYGEPTAKAAKKIPVPTGLGDAVRWEQHRIEFYGATILHKREPFLDPALKSRAITVRTWRDDERTSYEELSENSPLMPGITAGREILNNLGDFQLPGVAVPRSYHIQARIIDTWAPLLGVAQATGNQEWLKFAFGEMQKQSDTLKDGQSYEPSALVLQAMISELVIWNSENQKYELGWDRPLKVHESITEPIKRRYGRQVTAWQAAEILRHFSFNVYKSGGVNCVRPDLVTLIKACQEAGVEDELLATAIEKARAKGAQV